MALECTSHLQLRRLAGERGFARGELYHKEARVTDLSIDHEVISARVLGTETYRVHVPITA